MVKQRTLEEDYSSIKKDVGNFISNPIRFVKSMSIFKNTSSSQVVPTLRFGDMTIEDTKIKTEMDGFATTFKYFEFTDINSSKLKAMLSIKEGEDVVTFWSRLQWSYRSEKRLRLNKILIIVAFYGVAITPFYTVYGMPVNTAYSLFHWLLYLIFWFGIFVDCITTYLSPNGTVVHSYKMIIQKYLKSFFLIDLVAAIPFKFYQDEDFVEGFDWTTPDAKKPISIKSIIQTCFAFLKFGREFYRMETSGIFKASEIWYIFHILSLIFCFIHLSNILLFTACQSDESIWYSKENIGDRNVNSITVRYVVYQHAAVAYILGKGNPTSTYERIIATILNISGTLITALLVGQVSHYINKINAKSTHWKLKMNEINDSMEQMGLSDELRTRIRNYHAFSWAVNGGEDKRQMWLNDLSREYREAAKIQVNENLIASVPIFKDAQSEFTHAIIMHLKQQLYLPGDYITKYGDIGDEMYFVVKGTVQAMDKTETTLYTVLQEGSFFGEIALLKDNSLRTATVRAFTYSILNVLYKQDFERILRKFPDDAISIQREAKIRELNSINVEKNKGKLKSKLARRTNSESLENSEQDSHRSEETPKNQNSLIKTSTTVLAKLKFQKSQKYRNGTHHRPVFNLGKDDDSESDDYGPFTRKHQHQLLDTLKLLADHLAVSEPSSDSDDDEQLDIQDQLEVDEPTNNLTNSTANQICTE